MSIFYSVLNNPSKFLMIAFGIFLLALVLLFIFKYELFVKVLKTTALFFLSTPLLIIRPLLYVLAKFKFTSQLTTKALRKLDIFLNPLVDKIIKNFESQPSVLRGNAVDLHNYAGQKIRDPKHPLWDKINGVPKDLRRSFVEDGRMNVDPSILRYYPFAKGEDRNFIKYYICSAAFPFFLFFLPIALFLLLNFLGSDKYGSSGWDTSTLQHQTDIWNKLDREAEREQIKSVVSRVDFVYNAVQKIIFVVPLALMLTYVAGWLSLVIAGFATKSFMRKVAFSESRSKSLNIVLPDRFSKEAVVRHKFRLEERKRDLEAYEKQLFAIRTYDKTPTIRLGVATGDFRFRGNLASPYRGQEVLVSLNDLHQNMIIFGGTGAGKTRNMIKPILSQLMDLRKSEKSKENGINVSFFNTDSKGVLHVDVRKIAEEKGIADDVYVIGCDPEHEYSIDLLDGLSPQQVADIIRSVSGGENDFWQDMACNIILNFAILAYAQNLNYQPGDAEKPYSLLYIYKCISNQKATESLLYYAHKSRELLKTRTDALVDDLQLLSALKHVEANWLNLVPATKDGILANVTRMLGGFATGDLKIRNAFASGVSSRQMKVEDFWGKLICVNLPVQIYGLTAKTVNVFIKTRVFLNAIKRQSVYEVKLKRVEDEAVNVSQQSDWPLTQLPFADIPENILGISDKQAEAWDKYKRAANAVYGFASEQPFFIARSEDWVTEDGQGYNFVAIDRMRQFINQSINDMEKSVVERMRALLGDWIKAKKELETSGVVALPQFSRKATLEEISNSAALPANMGGNVKQLLQEWQSLKFELERNKLFFVADEYQDLITVGAASVPNDSTFWNVARSTGTTGIIATQSVAALQKQIDGAGGHQTQNFLSNMRTKVVLQVEDSETIEYIQRTLSGKTSRFLTFNQRYFESYEGYLREHNMLDPFVNFDFEDFSKHYQSLKPESTELDVSHMLATMSYGEFKKSVQDPDMTNGVRDLNGMHAIHADYSYADSMTTFQELGGSMNSVISAEQSAAWRAEDKYEKYMSEGVLTDQIETFNSRDMLSLGQTHAFISYIRAGRMKQDIVEVGRN